MIWGEHPNALTFLIVLKIKRGERAPGNNKAPGIIRPGYTPGYLQARILKKNESIQTQIEIAADRYIETWNQGHKDKIAIIDRYTDV